MKDRNLGTHEFFHTLGLSDRETSAYKGSIMYHLSDSLSGAIIPQEKLDLMRYIISDLRGMTHSTYSNPNLNTVNQLRQQLNNLTNGIKYNKNSFR